MKPRSVRFSADELTGATPEVKETLGVVFDQLNPFIKDTAAALDRRLTIKDNLVASYKTVNVTVPAPAWTAPTFANSWVNFGGATHNAGYRVDDRGFVYLRGNVKDGSAIATTMFTLPAGYRPAATLYYAVDANGAYGAVSVSAAGLVAGVAGSTTRVSLDGISFLATTPEGPPSYDGTGWPIYLKPDFTGYNVCDVQLVQVVDNATGEHRAHGAAKPDWRLGGKGQIIIDRVGGLTPERSYKLTFLLWGQN